MKVLMFGWEYPPHVYGGLATANFGITEGLHAQGDMDITLCLPKPFGDEDRTAARLLAMNAVPIAWRDVDFDYVKQRIGNIMDPQLYYQLRDHIYADFNYMGVNDLGCMEFAGGYPQNLHEEINNYSVIAGVVARTLDFDIIHAHDWLTFPAGIHAKQVSGKPLCIHVHATDFDRSRGHVNPTVYAIEKDGMDNADCIMCVSELTRQTVINQYHQDPNKCFAMHNAVYPLSEHVQQIVSKRKPFREKKEFNKSSFGDGFGGFERKADPGDWRLLYGEREDQGQAGQTKEDTGKVHYLQLNQSYIVTTVKSGLLIIDQHLAHGRILFERFLKEMENPTGHSQQELFPQPFTLNVNDASMFREMMPELERVGFDLEQVNATTFVIKGTPADLADANPAELLEKMLDNYKINRTDLQLDRKLSIAKTMASQLAVKPQTPLSEAEMQNIADQLFGCSVAEIAPDGKKIYVILAIDKITEQLNN